MLFDEFIPFLRDQRGLTGPLAIMGWSMGAYGALRAAELHPRQFTWVCAVSAALWRSYDVGVGDAFDGAADYAANDVFEGVDRLRGLPVRLDCGRQDPFYEADKAFVEAYRSRRREGSAPAATTTTSGAAWRRPRSTGSARSSRRLRRRPRRAPDPAPAGRGFRAERPRRAG